MARTIPAGLRTLLNSGDCESHSAIDITFSDGTTLHIATADVLVGATQYLPNLRQSGALKQSLRRVSDSVDLAAQNIDTLLGLTISGAATRMDGAQAVFSRIFIADDGTKYQVTLMSGEITGARANNKEVKFKVLSYLSAGGNIAGWRALAKHCQWVYKGDDGNCGSTDSATTCDKVYDSASGCAGRASATRITTPAATNNQDSFGGYTFIDKAVAVTAGSVDTTGLIFPTGGGGPTGGTIGRFDTGYDAIPGIAGRHFLPYYNAF